MKNLGRICGFGNKNCVVTREGTSAGGKLLRIVKKKSSLPSEATFSRAFKEFAESELGDIVHKAMIGEYLSEQIIVHISRDATAIVGNEKPAKKDKEEIKAKPAKKGEVRPEKEEKRLNLQINQIPNAFGTEALKDIPTVCMDAAYDAKPIHDVSKALGHVPIIDRNSRRGEALSRTPSGLRH